MKRGPPHPDLLGLASSLRLQELEETFEMDVACPHGLW